MFLINIQMIVFFGTHPLSSRYLQLKLETVMHNWSSTSTLPQCLRSGGSRQQGKGVDVCSLTPVVNREIVSIRLFMRIATTVCDFNIDGVLSHFDLFHYNPKPRIVNLLTQLEMDISCIIGEMSNWLLIRIFASCVHTYHQFIMDE